MSGPNSSYNTEPSNFEFDVVKYSNPYGKIAGVGCDGTKSGIDATLPKYSSPFIVGGNGYSFTNKPIGPVAGPNAPYSEIQMYNDSNKNYRDGIFPKEFKPMLSGAMLSGAMLSGGRRYKQYGCSKKHRHTHRRSHGGSDQKRRGGGHKSKRGGRKSKRGGHKSKRSGHKSKRSGRKRMRSGHKRSGRRTMRGGMSSAADYTQGRDTSQDQPYGNKAYSFGQGLDSMLGPNESALASPPPFLPYNNCGKYART